MKCWAKGMVGVAPLDGRMQLVVERGLNLTVVTAGLSDELRRI